MASTTESSDEALGALFEACQRQLLSYARRRVGDDAAADIVAEVFVAALRHHRRSGETNIRWLFGVARHKIADHWRRVDREYRLHSTLRQQPISTSPPAESTAFGSFVLEFDRVSAPQRELLARHYLDGEPLTEIATNEQRTYKSVESAMHRARCALRHEWAN